MGTKKPLTIRLHRDLYLDLYKELENQGHRVGGPGMFAVEAADLYLGPNAWRMTPELLKYLPVAIKAAQALKYPKKEKK